MIRAWMDENRQREWRRQMALMERLENKFVASLSTGIYNASAEMISAWKITREVIPARGFRDKLEDIYKDMIVSSAVSFGVRIWQQGKSAGVDLEHKQDFSQFMMSEALRYLAREVIRRRIGGVEMETRQNIIRAIARGYAEGLGQDAIADMIMDTMEGISQWRARMIARTEVHGAANYGAYEAAKRTGLPMQKEWISAIDKRTRSLENGDEYGHLEFNGTKVGMDEAFVFTSKAGIEDRLMYPGDPNGAAGNVINCRCTTGFVVDTEALL